MRASGRAVERPSGRAAERPSGGRRSAVGGRLAATICLLAAVAAGCDERMRDQPSLMPHDKPLLSMPAGVVPVSGGEPAASVEEAAALENPVANVPEELERGALAYRRFCGHCHGASGRGWTVVGASLDPAPTDLSLAVPARTDGELFGIITFGAKTSPALGPFIDVNDRWRIVRWLRVLPTASSSAAAGTP
ncbi:MAG: cytochrome c [Deltaproteobacteria bacterium]|nr:cytochrome c [Deltaproteobacteria bacterium]